MAVPGQSFYSDLSHIAAEAAVAVEQRRMRAGARGRQRRRKPGRTAADHQHLGFRHYIDVSRRFIDLPHRHILAPKITG